MISTVWLTLQVALVAVALGLPVAIVLGYWLARWQHPLRWVVETVLHLPLVIPPVVTGYLLLVAFGRSGWLGQLLEQVGLRIAFDWKGAVLAAAVVALPLMIRATRQAFASLDARLEQTARSLGAGPLDVFVTVSVPLAWRGILSGAVLGFARGLGEFGATIMIAGNIPGETRTIPLAIFSEVQRPGGLEGAALLVVLSIVLAGGALAVSQWLERKGAGDEPVA